ncbi:MAG: glycosyltransferase family 4 protein [Geminicoccaceae bacterium]|nr:glycosyltransferase family 4 protein [Geminicoccaceae bacterium]MDW8369582.1 glycosyltransferase family 4 protein [Geminicoccaceae bacterium]
MPGGFEFGGIGRIMLYTTRAWAASGDGPDWFVLDPRGPGSLLVAPARLLGALGRIALERARDRLDLVHLNVAGRGSTVRKVILALWAELWRTPTIVHLHDFDYPADLARRPAWQRRLVRRMFERARFCLVLGERDRSFVIECLGVPVERVVVRPNAVPDPGPPPQRAGRTGPIRLLFLGHLSERKGVPELLDALARPALRARDWRLTLAGGGERVRFQAEALRLGLGDRCAFPGWVDHERAYELLRAADILLLPSHAEGQAMALLEAMAHGLAIVTTPVGAHREAVVHEREALLVPPGDPAALAAAIARLIDDPALRDRLGAAARARWRACFAIEAYARELAALYSRALAADGGGRSSADG